MLWNEKTHFRTRNVVSAIYETQAPDLVLTDTGTCPHNCMRRPIPLATVNSIRVKFRLSSRAFHSVWPVCRNSVNAKGRGLAFSKRRNAREAQVQNELMLLRAEVARHAQPAI